MIGHSSLAAQNGVAKAPRVILFEGDDVEPSNSHAPKLVMSFGIHHQNTNRSSSIEMAFTNPINHELEFFDLPFAAQERGHLSSKNPQVCMSCHGSQGVTPEAGGPKYIFDPFQDWPRFAGGATNCSPEENKLQQIASDRAVQAVKEEKTFECLDKSTLELKETGKAPQDRYPKLDSTLQRFDLRISKARGEQARKWVAALPTYPVYKFFLIGSQLCEPLKLKQWMPVSVINRNSTKLDVDPRLTGSEDLITQYERASLEEFEKVQARRKVNADLIAHPEKVFNSGFDPDMSPKACLESRNSIKDGVNALRQMAKHSLDFSTDPQDPLARLAFDNRLRGTRLGQSLPEPALRFFLEGEEYGTFMIQSSFRPGDLVRGSYVPSLEEEPTGSPLLELFKISSQRICVGKCIRGPNTQKYEPKNFPSICEDLKKLSIAAFNRSENQPPAPSSTTGKK